MDKKAPAPVVLITGAAGGIGRRLIEALATAGYRVVATDRAAALAAATAWVPPGVELQELDVTDADQWSKVVAQVVAGHGMINVLLHCAGYLLPGAIDQLDSAVVTRHLDVNTQGVILGTCAVVPHMVARKSGQIITIASLAGVAPIPGIALYSASKAAARAFSLAAALELRRQGVYVTVINPDAVQTPMLDLQIDYPEAAATFSGGRILTPDDVVKAVFEALKRRPLEIMIPWSRGLLARLADALPQLALLLGSAITRRGLRRQARMRRGARRPALQ